MKSFNRPYLKLFILFLLLLIYPFSCVLESLFSICQTDFSDLSANFICHICLCLFPILFSWFYSTTAHKKLKPLFFSFLLKTFVLIHITRFPLLSAFSLSVYRYPILMNALSFLFLFVCSILVLSPSFSLCQDLTAP